MVRSGAGVYAAGGAHDPTQPIDVVHVGAACRDIAPDDPRGWRLGGGVTYAALTTARLGSATAAVIGVDARGARGARARRARGPPASTCSSSPLGAGSGLPQRRDARRAGSRPSLSVGRPGAAASRSRTRGWRRAALVVRAGRRRGRPRPGPTCPRATRSSAVGWQGMLRDAACRASAVAPAAAGADARCSRRADLVGVSRDDVDRRRRASPTSPRCSGRARGSLVTRGAEGGLLVGRRRRRPARDAALPARRASDGEVDPTGAGDTFLAALLAATVRPATARADAAARGARPPVRGGGRRRWPSRTSASTGCRTAARSWSGGPGSASAGRSCRARPRRSADVAPASRRGAAGQVRLAGARSGMPEAAAALDGGRGRAASPRGRASGRRRRCSRSLASSIQASDATRPGPAARPDQASTASSPATEAAEQVGPIDARSAGASHGAVTATRRSGPSATVRRPVRGRPPKSGRASRRPPRRRRIRRSAGRAARAVGHAVDGSAGAGSGGAASMRSRADVEAGERLRPGVARGRRPGPARRGRPAGAVAACLQVRVARVEEPEQAGQRPDVLVVVADDRRERLRRPAAQEVRGSAPGSPSRRRRRAGSRRAAPLDGPQPGVVHPVPEHAPDDGQQVEVARRGPGASRRASR